MKSSKVKNPKWLDEMQQQKDATQALRRRIESLRVQLDRHLEDGSEELQQLRFFRKHAAILLAMKTGWSNMRVLETVNGIAQNDRDNGGTYTL